MDLCTPMEADNTSISQETSQDIVLMARFLEIPQITIHIIQKIQRNDKTRNYT